MQDKRTIPGPNIFNSGFFAIESGELVLTDTGVNAGSYNNPELTVDPQGRITSINDGL